MTKSKDTLQLLNFIDTLKQRFRWEIPSINEPTDIFEIEKVTKNIWRYRLTTSPEWIESSTSTLLSALDKNDVNLSFFKQQLRESIMSSITYSYNVVQEACLLFGEDEVYNRLEEEYNKLEEDLDNVIQGDFRLIQKKVQKRKD